MSVEEKLRKEFPPRIRRVVRSNGGVRKFSRRLGCSRNCVYYWLKGERLPDMASLVVMGKAGVDLNYLLMGWTS